LTIRIVALTGVWELHPTKRFATDCLNRSAARGRKSSVSCFAHQKSAEDRNHLLRRQVSTRGRALCGAQIRNVRPVLVRTFRGYKIANGASLCVTSPASRKVPSNGSRRWDNRGGYDQDISIKQQKNGAPCLQLARERARQPRGGSKGHWGDGGRPPDANSVSR
jgi:hypothetical protein